MNTQIQNILIDKFSLFLDEFSDEITRQNIVESYENLLNDYKNRSQHAVPIFSYDEETEHKELRKLLKALYKVIYWYSSPDQLSKLEKIND